MPMRLSQFSHAWSRAVSFQNLKICYSNVLIRVLSIKFPKSYWRPNPFPPKVSHFPRRPLSVFSPSICLFSGGIIKLTPNLNSRISRQVSTQRRRGCKLEHTKVISTTLFPLLQSCLCLKVENNLLASCISPRACAALLTSLFAWSGASDEGLIERKWCVRRWKELTWGEEFWKIKNG